MLLLGCTTTTIHVEPRDDVQPCFQTRPDGGGCVTGCAANTDTVSVGGVEYDCVDACEECR